MRTSKLRAQLDASEARYQQAVENCPHWDYESDGESSSCCHELEDAKAERRRARIAYEEDDHGRG
jgi:hypothetical protein